MTAFPMVRGRRLRATKLDACGNVVLGAKSKVTTKGFISVGLTANTDEGETISVINASGEECVHDEPAPKFTGWTIEVQFCNVDPELFTLMTGQPLVLSADGMTAVGFRVNTKIDLNNSGFALELWTGVPSDACADASQQSFGYMLVPFSKGGTIGDLTVENGAVNFTMTGAKSKDGTNWGVGPYTVTRGAGGTPGPLNLALDKADHLHTELVTVAPPLVEDGAKPVGVPATTVTAASPATLTPANSYLPYDLAAANAATTLTKSPTTAWLTGKYAVLGNGSTAYWNGTTWIAGIAP